jgi:GNAT superfamily N-acetyltransferase
MHIATATPADVPALALLLGELFSQESEFAPDEAAQRSGLARIIANPDVGVILVAKDDETVVGMVNILFTISTALGARVAILEDMIVAARFRGAGIGRRLLDHAVAVVRENGGRRVTLLTDRSNEAAQRFYERSGFVPSPMIPLRLALAETGRAGEPTI